MFVFMVILNSIDVYVDVDIDVGIDVDIDVVKEVDADFDYLSSFVRLNLPRAKTEPL